MWAANMQDDNVEYYQQILTQIFSSVRLFQRALITRLWLRTIYSNFNCLCYLKQISNFSLTTHSHFFLVLGALSQCILHSVVVMINLSTVTRCFQM